MLKRVILAYMFIIVTVIAVIALSLFYDWFRRIINIHKVGFEKFSSKRIRPGDYVCINGRVWQFDHWTSDNEIIDPISPPIEDNMTCKGNLAFSTNGLGYKLFPFSILRNCEFIYGKYGLKWAISEEYAHSAEAIIRQYKQQY